MGWTGKLGLRPEAASLTDLPSVTVPSINVDDLTDVSLEGTIGAGGADTTIVAVGNPCAVPDTSPVDGSGQWDSGTIQYLW